MQGGDLEEEAREYCVFLSMISRGKLGGYLELGKVLEDADGYCSIPDFHFCPRFGGVESLKATLRRHEYFQLSGGGWVSLADGDDARMKMYWFQPGKDTAESYKSHFDMCYATARYLGIYFLNNDLEPPLISFVNKFNAGRMFPIDGKKSIEPDLTLALRGWRSWSFFGFRKRVAVEVQRTNPNNMYDKLRKYTELELTQEPDERMFLLVVFPSEKPYFISEFREKALEMGWIEDIDYSIITVDGERFERIQKIR